MQSKAATVEEYLAELPIERRRELEAVRKVLRKHLDKGYEEGMQYGMIGYYVPHSLYPPGYHCDPKQPLPFVCLAAQKNYLSLYLGCVYCDEQIDPFKEAWAKTGKKLDMGKTCIRFQRADDLALDVIADTLRRMPVKKFVAYYESVIQGSRSGSRKAAAKKAAKPAAKAKSVTRAARRPAPARKG